MPEPFGKVDAAFFSVRLAAQEGRNLDPVLVRAHVVVVVVSRDRRLGAGGRGARVRRLQMTRHPVDQRADPEARLATDMIRRLKLRSKA